MKDQFYLTLPSNSSMNFYPQNTVSNYITHLSRAIQLDGEWEVAVVGVYYPCTFLTSGQNTMIYIHAYPEEDRRKVISSIESSKVEGGLSEHENGENLIIPTIHVATVPHGNYASEKEFIDTINKNDTLRRHGRLQYDEQTKKVRIVTNPSVAQVEISHTLALQLGFDPSESDLKTNNTSIRPANLYLGFPSLMYIYCDIVDSQFIGDTMAPLLQIVNIDTSNYVYGSNTHVQFFSPHYVSVLKTHFESLEIDLRDGTGNPLTFQFGTSCVKLHFRRKRES